MVKTAEPLSGTRDFLAADVLRRRAAFERVSEVFEQHGFRPLGNSGAFRRRLETLRARISEEMGSTEWIRRLSAHTTA